MSTPNPQSKGKFFIDSNSANLDMTNNSELQVKITKKWSTFGEKSKNLNRKLNQTTTENCSKID